MNVLDWALRPAVQAFGGPGGDVGGGVGRHRPDLQGSRYIVRIEQRYLMVVPERLPMPLACSSDVSASTASAAWVVAVPLAASSAFTALPKWRSFTAQYKLRILAETDRAADTGGISAILRREGL